jgi:hypothetical protein
MSFFRKRPDVRDAHDVPAGPALAPARDFLAVLRGFDNFAKLGAKIARARTQDRPVLYAGVLPGLDVLICKVRGAQSPYPDAQVLCGACVESIGNALEQPIAGLQEGGYWYEIGGLGFLIFSSQVRERIVFEFGASGPPRPTRHTFRQLR